MKKLFTILTIIIILFGCGVDDNDDDSCGNTVPIITKVSFHDCYDCDGDKCYVDYEYTIYEFDIDDKFDIIIEATDCGLDMKWLSIIECYIDGLITLCYDPVYYELPDNQVDVERGYHFGLCFTMDGPVGYKTYKFQIEDSAGYISNIFEVIIEVE